MGLNCCRFIFVVFLYKSLFIGLIKLHKKVVVGWIKLYKSLFIGLIKFSLGIILTTSGESFCKS